MALSVPLGKRSMLGASIAECAQDQQDVISKEPAMIAIQEVGSLIGVMIRELPIGRDMNMAEAEKTSGMAGKV